MTEVKASPKSEIVATPPTPTPPPAALAGVALQEDAQKQTNAMLQIIKEVALSPNVNVEAIRAMMEMQRQLTKDQAERTFNTAMAEMAPLLPRVKRNGKVEYLIDKNNKNSGKEEAFRFAKYEDMDLVIRPILAQFGFSLSFTTKPRTADGGGLIQVGYLKHKDGHQTEAEFAAALDSSGGKNNIQAMKSSSSYGKRAVVEFLLNIVTEGADDDGNSASAIDDKQAEALKNKIKDTGTDTARFLKLFAVKSVDEIQSRDYDKAVALLATKEKTKGAA